MEHLWDYMHQITGIFIFCFGLSLLLYTNRQLNELIITTNQQVTNANTLYEQENNEMMGNVCTYNQLIAITLGTLDYDIRIENLYIEADYFNPLEFDYSQIPIKEYRKTYEYDDSGQISLVCYQ